MVLRLNFESALRRIDAWDFLVSSAPDRDFPALLRYS